MLGDLPGYCNNPGTECVPLNNGSCVEAGLNIFRGLSPLGCANRLNIEEEAAQHQNRPKDSGPISQKEGTTTYLPRGETERCMLGGENRGSLFSIVRCP